MKKKRQKPTVRDILKDVNELKAVSIQLMEWTGYLRRTTEVISETLYSYLELNEDVDRLTGFMDDKKKEKSDAISDEERPDDSVSGEGNKGSKKVHGESV